MRSIAAKSARCWSRERGRHARALVVVPKRERVRRRRWLALAQAKQALRYRRIVRLRKAGRLPGLVGATVFCRAVDINDLACGQSTRFPPSRLRASWLEPDPVAVVGEVLTEKIFLMGARSRRGLSGS